MQNKDWTPVELSHYYDADIKQSYQYATISNAIDKLIQVISDRERYKNGLVLKSELTAKTYYYLKLSLEKFTRSKYHRDFTKYHFRDINEKFVQDFAVWLQIKGAKNGNNGDVIGKLRRVKAVCLYAKKMGTYSVDVHIFDSLKAKIKPRIVTPKGVSIDIILSIESFDRTLLAKRERLYLDLFLFSFYAGGISPIDVCLLTRDFIKDGIIIYDRMKYDKQARVIIIDKAAEIMERYRKDAYMNYIFPTIKHRNLPQTKLYRRVKWINKRVNETLRKICEHLEIKSKVT